VRLRATLQSDLGLVAELSGDRIELAGFGGYQSVAREGRVALTAYQGRDPSRVPLGLIVDRWAQQQSIEAEIEVLERLAGYYGRPPQLIFEGAGIPHSHQREPAARWVIGEDPAWNRVLTRPRDGARCYLEAGIVLMRLERPDPDDITDATTRRLHSVRRGSELVTLNRLARHYRTSWTRLRQLNAGARDVPADPDRRMKVGTKVRIS